MQYVIAEKKLFMIYFPSETQKWIKFLWTLVKVIIHDTIKVENYSIRENREFNKQCWEIEYLQKS